MITLLVILLIFVSLVLIITIPVALATPGEWKATKLTFNKIFQIWVCLILVIAASDGIASSM